MTPTPAPSPEAPEDSVTLRTLRRAQADAWANGHTRLPLRALLSMRRARGAELFVDEVEDGPRDDLSFSGVAAADLSAAERRIPGASLLQDSPGIARSSARWRRRDPQRAGSHVKRILKAQGWTSIIAVARVAENWESIVGPQVAEHARVEQIEDGRLNVRTTSTAWAVHLRSLLPQLMRNIDEAVGPGVVQTVVVKGPDQPSWSHGPRSVRGRGVRDTYA
ncbi:DUF721 domain-containing protein [Nanchangia anserum]|uniref:DUF721 domain-containing protein n=1 Tax=Nanchangia anserum TaxID=2692125 RepID=A0A8I0KRN8_9ACTO|nr:DciA family protein [Nanchangia anserum]MBD3689587.1 DUF721 domain-containing protein [Nanchangia anserum]QOX81770.1 DUF721 domain-containing protein [Nanchangia anserum]